MRAYFNSVIQKIKSNAIRPYDNGDYWYRRKDRTFLLRQTPLPEPGELLLPNILLVFPDRIVGGGDALRCFRSECGGIFKPNGESLSVFETENQRLMAGGRIQQ